MPFTYNPAILASSSHPDYDLIRARLILGDTVERYQLLDDEEIRNMLADAPSFTEGVARAGEAVIARYSHEASFSVGNYRVELAGRIANTRQLVEDVRNQPGARGNTAGPEAVPAWTRGLFRKGMMGSNGSYANRRGRSDEMEFPDG
jgi:hypothetical protein